jgi:hypothetical protein
MSNTVNLYPSCSVDAARERRNSKILISEETKINENISITKDGNLSAPKFGCKMYGKEFLS